MCHTLPYCAIVHTSAHFPAISAHVVFMSCSCRVHVVFSSFLFRLSIFVGQERHVGKLVKLVLLNLGSA